MATFSVRGLVSIENEPYDTIFPVRGFTEQQIFIELLNRISYIYLFIKLAKNIDNHPQ